MSFLKIFYPDEYRDSTYSLDFQKYYDMGYRGILFDIDNTLVPHGAPATKESVELFEKLRSIGFMLVLVLLIRFELFVLGKRMVKLLP